MSLRRTKKKKKKKKRGEMIDLLIFQMYGTCKEGSHTRRNMSNCKREGGGGGKGTYNCHDRRRG
jgi:hypothetical protein